MAVTANSPIGVGDVVALKSGGPSMTVESFDPAPVPVAGQPQFITDRMIRCIWMTVAGGMDSRAFYSHTLVKQGGDGGASANAVDGRGERRLADGTIVRDDGTYTPQHDTDAAALARAKAGSRQTAEPVTDAQKAQAEADRKAEAERRAAAAKSASMV